MVRQKVEQVEATDEEPGEQHARRTFVASAATERIEPGQAGETDADEIEEVEPLDQRTVVVGSVMAMIALVCFVLAIGSSASGSEVTLDEADEQEIFTVREQIQSLTSQADGLPDAKDADRRLVTALQAADRVAGLQNDYRRLAPDAAQADGVLDAAQTDSVRQELTPYFTPSVDSTVLDPWYLLAADATASKGIGTPDNFEAGVKWVVEAPATISADGTIPVTWKAVETHPAEGTSPRVLAWVKADYDMTRQTFFDVSRGVSVRGAAEQLEVSIR